MSVSAVGRHEHTSIAGGVYEMWQQGQEITAVIVATQQGLRVRLSVGYHVPALFSRP
jgi:hypothetical protein